MSKESYNLILQMIGCWCTSFC